jgi:hypothetical protein
MNPALFKVKTMCGKDYEVSAISPCQAITIWTKTKPKDQLFKSCTLIKSSKDVDRYFELKGMCERSNHEENELKLMIETFRNSDIFKENKNFNSFKMI